MMDESKPSRPARSQRRTRNESISIKPQGSELNNYRQNSLESLDDGTFGEINNVLKQVKHEWAYVMEPNFNPVTLGLALLDESQADALNSFLDTKHNLEEALQSIFNTHSEAFQNTIAAHQSFDNTLQDTVNTINDTKYSLKEARDGLDVRRADLKQLWAKGSKLREAMQIIDQIEKLKLVPDELESLIIDKKWIEAVILLRNSLKAIQQPSILEVGATSDLRSFLQSQENALQELLIEELINHLFLKSNYSETRWKAYKPNIDQPSSPTPSEFSTFDDKLDKFLNKLDKSPLKDFDKIDDTLSLPNNIPESSPTLTSPIPSPSFNHELSMEKIDKESLSQNIQSSSESESFDYMQTLLEGLFILGKLSDALDLLPQRLPNEIQSIISTTIDQVSSRSDSRQKAREESHEKQTLTAPAASSAVTAGIISSLFKSSENINKARELDVCAHILKDLFFTLYSKLDAVIRGLRVISQVSKKISDNSYFLPLEGLWRLVQIEVQKLIQEYLVDDSQGGIGSSQNLVASINDVLRQVNNSRDRSKFLFKFSDSDTKSCYEILRPHEEELQRILQTTVPGLVSNQTSNINLLDSSTLSIGIESERKYNRLAKADPFNIPVLFQPTCSFIDHTSEILKLKKPKLDSEGLEESNGLREYMDNFIEKVFLPQLQDKVMELFQGAVASTDAFSEETNREGDSPKPVVKSVFGLLDLISHLSEMLRSTPFHREAYSRLIITVIIQYYQRSSERFIDLVGRDTSSNRTEKDNTPELKLSAKWAQRNELTACLAELLATPDSDVNRKRELCAQESRVEMGINDAVRVRQEDLICSKKKMMGLGNLFSSLKWFIVKLSALKVASEQLLPDEDTRAQRAAFNPNDQADLPLTKDMVLRFEALLQTYHQLIDMILFTMRLEVRVITVYYLDLAMRKGNYEVDESSNNPDINVIKLNNEINELDEAASRTLTEEERRFLFDGVGLLMDKILMSATKTINKASSQGAGKMLRNISALQQNLKTIITWPVGIDFSQSRKFWELFLQDPKDWLENLRHNKPEFSFDEYECLLKLQCGISQSENEINITNDRTRRIYNDYHIELHQLMMDDEF